MHDAQARDRVSHAKLFTVRLSPLGPFIWGSKLKLDFPLKDARAGGSRFRFRNVTRVLKRN
jgi:hypothetical protein